MTTFAVSSDVLANLLCVNLPFGFWPSESEEGFRVLGLETIVSCVRERVLYGVCWRMAEGLVMKRGIRFDVFDRRIWSEHCKRWGFDKREHGVELGLDWRLLFEILEGRDWERSEVFAVDVWDHISILELKCARDRLRELVSKKGSV